MAKVTGPLMSMDARGGFGGAIVFSAWKGRNTVRQLVVPANPKTANQVAARNMVRASGSAQKAVNGSVQIRTGQALTDKALLKLAAPNGYAWNGYLTDSMIGAGALNYTAGQAAWAALAAGEKAAWSVAADARVPAVFPAAQQIAGGGAGVALTSGNVYFLQQYGLYVSGVYDTAPGAIPPTYA